MKTVHWFDMSATERNAFVATTFDVGQDNYSRDLSACFRLAEEKHIPLLVYRNGNGEVWAAIRNSDDGSNFGRIDPAEAVCRALLSFAGIEVSIVVYERETGNIHYHLQPL